MEGKSILFVGTKKQAQESHRVRSARAAACYYVNNRWLGGMLTNFRTIRTRMERLNQIDKMEQHGQFELLPKKEVIKLQNEREKLEKNLGGIREMKKLPGALFIVDPRKEHIAVAEARALGIPIVAIVDTNCDPDEDRLRHPRQRRRHPCGQTDRRQAGGRCSGRQAGRAGRRRRSRSRRRNRQGGRIIQHKDCQREASPSGTPCLFY